MLAPDVRNTTAVLIKSVVLEVAVLSAAEAIVIKIMAMLELPNLLWAKRGEATSTNVNTLTHSKARCVPK